MGDEGRDSTHTLPEAVRTKLLLQERVIGVRIVGTTIAHVFPLEFSELTIGSGPDCSIRIADASVSRRHARIEHRGAHVILVDTDSKNGCQVDGEPRALIQLVPGGWFKLGTVELVAFSHESERTRTTYQRYLGYDEPSQLAVDRAHQAVQHRRHLVLVTPPGGSDKLIAAIHQITTGGTWPLVAPKQISKERAEQKQLLTSAAHGTLALPLSALPDDHAFLLDSLRSRTYGARAIFVAPIGPKVTTAIAKKLGAIAHDCVAITVPPLKARQHEASRLIDAAVAEHASRLGANTAVLTPHDYERLLAQAWPKNHDEMSDTIQRLVAMRVHRGRATARMLGMSPSSISEWRVKYGFHLDDD